jgi:hypothetical protein
MVNSQLRRHRELEQPTTLCLGAEPVEMGAMWKGFSCGSIIWQTTTERKPDELMVFGHQLEFATHGPNLQRSPWRVHCRGLYEFPMAA